MWLSPFIADNDAHDALNGEICQVDDRAETVITSEQSQEKCTFGRVQKTGWGSRGRRFKSCRPD